MQKRDQTDQMERDNRKKKDDIQREMIMSETELRKFASEKKSVDAELSRFKKNIDDLRSNMQKKQERIQKIEQDTKEKQSEINKLKKQLNSM